MSGDKREPLLIPRAELSKLRFAALLAHAEEWIHFHYMPSDASERDAWEEPDEELVSESTIEVLSRAFADVLDPGRIVALAAQLDKQSIAWTRKASRRALPSGSHTMLFEPREEERTHGRDPEEIVAAAHRNLQRALAELQEIRARVEPTSSRIGDNYPPDEIGVPPYSDEDDASVELAVSILAKQPVVVPVPNPTVEAAADRLEKTGNAILDYCRKLGDLAAQEFAKTVGKSAAVGVTGLTVLGLLGEKLIHVAQTALQWLEAIKLFM